MSAGNWSCTWVLLSAISVSCAIAAEPFQIKGVRLGQSVGRACGASEVTSKLDDLVDRFKARAPDLVEMESSECHVLIESFGGLKVDGGMDLLFLRDQLIQVKFQLEPVHWMKYAEIFSPLAAMYGEPTISRGDVFTSHKWQQGTSTLSLTRADNPSGVESLEIVLRDEDLFRTYYERVERNGRVFQGLGEEQIKGDIRN